MILELRLCKEPRERLPGQTLLMGDLLLDEFQRHAEIPFASLIQNELKNGSYQARVGDLNFKVLALVTLFLEIKNLKVLLLILEDR